MSEPIIRILASERDPQGRGGEVRAVELIVLTDGTIALRTAKGQDYGADPDRDPLDFRRHYAATDGINWYHRSMSAYLEPATARWLASQLNALAAAQQEV